LQRSFFLIKKVQLTGKLGIRKHICLVKFEYPCNAFILVVFVLIGHDVVGRESISEIPISYFASVLLLNKYML
jgi:hypothetical protein